MLKRTLISCMLAVAVIAAGPGAPGTAAVSDVPVEINVILPQTGAGAFIADKAATSLSIIESVVNKSGGIQGRPLKFVLHDDGSNPQNGVQLASALVAKHVNVILGSELAAICKAIEPLVKDGPVDYCYSPNLEFSPGSYMFTASLGTEDTITIMLRYFKARGWNRIALITSTDASGEDFDKPFLAAMSAPSAAGLKLVAHERFNTQDISVAAQIARIKAAAPQVLMAYAIGPPFGTVVRGANDAGIDVPLFGAAGDLSYRQLAGYKTFAKELYFITAGGAAPISNAKPAQQRAQDLFLKAFATANVRPEYLYAEAWDPPMLIVDALRRLGPDVSPARLRDYISTLRGWTGISGTYDFRARPQRGLGPNAAVIYRWEAATEQITVLPFASTGN